MDPIKPIEETSPELAQMFMDICAGKLNATIENTRVWRTIGPRRIYGKMNRKCEEILLAEPGRNYPCLCGSGKKFKKCCGTNA